MGIYGGIALAVDGSGNVYVTGESYGDYPTIKYTSTGDTVWVRRYGGWYTSGATDIAVDASGNVYVTGRSQGSGTDDDYATIKYTSAGDTVWVRHYNGPGNVDDRASSLAIDGSGNVYVTGGSNGDYATINYTSAGDTVWVRHYNGPGKSRDGATALAVDASRNVYVTGESYGSDHFIDYATIKYTSAGDTAWVRRYNGPGDSSDYATALAVDASGNVYVTGRSQGSGTDDDYATIKYTSAGDTAWVRRYNGPENGWDWATALAVDASGNVYVTGRSVYWPRIFEYATIKYTSAGDTAWVRRYGGDVATSLAVDASGNVYVTGSSGSYPNSDYATVKYTSTGDTAWVRRYSGSESWSYDVARALAVDASGNVYVTGSSDGSGRYSDYATVKYTSTGDMAWVRRYGGGYAAALAVDAGGNVYVTGNGGTIKYNSSGDSAWTRSFAGVDLAVDASGNVYVTGSSAGQSATIKYDAAGNQEWLAQYSYPGGTSTPVGLKLDAQNNIYLAGTSSVNGQSYYTVIKYRQTPNAVRENDGSVPTTFALSQNYPNPFNPLTTIRYSLPSTANVKLAIYDLLGREIATLVNEEQSAGWKEVEWNASAFSSGIYFYRLTAGNYVGVKKLMLLK